MTTPVYSGVSYTTPSAGGVGQMTYDPVTDKLFVIVDDGNGPSPTPTNVLVKLDPVTLTEITRSHLMSAGNNIAQGYGLVADGANGFIYLDCNYYPSTENEHILKIRMSDLAVVGDITLNAPAGSGSPPGYDTSNLQLVIDTANGFLYRIGAGFNATFWPNGAPSILNKVNLSTFTLVDYNNYMVDPGGGDVVYGFTISTDGHFFYLIDSQEPSHITKIDTTTSGMPAVNLATTLTINDATTLSYVLGNVYVATSTFGTPTFNKISPSSPFATITSVSNSDIGTYFRSDEEDGIYSNHLVDLTQNRIYLVTQKPTSPNTVHLTEFDLTPTIQSTINLTTANDANQGKGFMSTIKPGTAIYVGYGNSGGFNSTTAFVDKYSISSGPAPSFLPNPFAPAVGAAGDVIVMRGSHFTGATNVSFNGTSATFTVINDTTIKVTVPGATTGPVSVTTAAGTTSTGQPFLIQAVLIGPAAFHYS